MGQNLALCWLAQNTIIALRLPLGWGHRWRMNVNRKSYCQQNLEPSESSTSLTRLDLAHGTYLARLNLARGTSLARL